MVQKKDRADRGVNSATKSAQGYSIEEAFVRRKDEIDLNYPKQIWLLYREKGFRVNDFFIDKMKP